MKKINKPIFFLPVESTPRELDYKLNIARILCEEGFDIIIGNPPFIRDELKYKNYKGAFLEKGGNPDPEYYQLLVDKGIFLYCLSDEGAAIPSYSVTYEPAVNVLKKMRCIFLWGDLQKQDLIDRNNNKELIEKYLVSGYPGFEFSDPKYINYHECLKPGTLPNSYILINTNFASYNGFSLEEVYEACSMMSPETRKSIIDSYEREEKAFQLFFEWLLKIITSFPHEQFLLRPHPVERLENYERLLSNKKNVIILRDGNVNQVISGAKLVLHNDCTSALQSYLMKKAVISLAQSNINYLHSPWALNFSYVPNTMEETIEAISNVIKDGKLSDNINNDVNYRMKKVGATMFNNFVDSTSIVTKSILEDYNTNKANFIPYNLTNNRTTIQKIKHFVRRFLPLHYKVPIASRGALAKFTKKDLIKRLNLMNDLEEKTALYKINKMFPNTFYIRKVL